MAPTNPIIREERDAREYLTDYPEIKLLNARIQDRKVYRDAMSEGKGIIEMDNPKAKLELKKLMQEIFQW
jgi:chromosome partitioning protein